MHKTCYLKIFVVQYLNRYKLVCHYYREHWETYYTNGVLSLEVQNNSVQDKVFECQLQRLTKLTNYYIY